MAMTGESGGKYNSGDNIRLMREKINKRRKKRKNLIIIISAIAAAIVISCVLWSVNKTYSGYKIISSEARDSDTTSSYIPYDGGYMRYSSTGIQYTDASGKSLWNESFTMSNPAYSKKGDKVVIYDISGNNILVFDSTGRIGQSETRYEIIKAEISETGSVAALLKDATDSYINLYSLQGEIIYSIKTSLEGDGQPVDFCISSDASKLGASYVRTETSQVKSGLCIYDFGKEAGDAASKKIADFDYGSRLIGDVAFLSGDSLVAVSEDNIKFYNVGSDAKETGSYDIKGMIKRVFTDDGYIGLYINSADEADPGRIMIFNNHGRLSCERSMPDIYNNYTINDNLLVMSGNNRLSVMTTGGKLLTDQALNDSVKTVINNKGKNRYFLISDRYIRQIKLT